MSDIDQAISEWSLILGDSNIATHGEKFETTKATTFKAPHGILAVLYPRNTEEVSSIVKVAAQYKVPVYPVSMGKNFGLGSKLPALAHCAVIDLGGMNEISGFDEEMAWVRLQPGVSFLQLEQFLSGKGSGLMMDSIGSTPHASIIGNTVERGHGLGLLADRFAHVCNFEVVLADGSIINTGFGAIPETKVANLSRWGLGPFTEGLFTQGNMGIVTSMTFWLKPKSDHFQSFVFHVDGEEQLGLLVDQVRKLRLSGVQMSLRIFNDIRMIAFFQQYPWNEHEGAPLSNEMRARLRSKYGIKGNWIGIGAVYPLNEKYAAADSATIEGSLKQYTAHWEYFDKKNAGEIVGKNPEREKEINFLFEKSSLKGLTSDRPIAMCYWRKKGAVPMEMDIHKDKCGVLWYCPVVPARADDVRFAAKLVESISKKHGFEPNIGFLFISERALDITGAICYDREIPGEDERAMACHNELLLAFYNAGYPPYRLGIQSMDMVLEQDQNSLCMLQALKSSLDPHGIISPGRYIK